MHRVRIVLTQISSIEPVGAIKSSLSDLTEVTAAFVPPGRERRRCSRRSHLSPIDLGRDRIFCGCGPLRPDGGLSGARNPHNRGYGATTALPYGFLAVVW